MTRNGLLRKVILLTVVALAFCPCRTANAQEGITENPGSSSPVDLGLSYALTGDIINSDSLTIFANNNGQLLFVERSLRDREYAWEWSNSNRIQTTSTLNLGPYSVSNGTAIQNNALAHAHTAAIQNGGVQTIEVTKDNGAKLYMTVHWIKDQEETPISAKNSLTGEQRTTWLGTLVIKFWVDIGGEKVELKIADMPQTERNNLTARGFAEDTTRNYFSLAHVIVYSGMPDTGSGIQSSSNAIPATTSIYVQRYLNVGDYYLYSGDPLILNPDTAFPTLDPSLYAPYKRAVIASGYLTINSGKIEGTDTAIGSVGTLNVNNTFIQAGQIGIL
ncbi:MAG: hypothetical protein LBH00_11225, partial [Planctomycetaceae bacterium]|nr:hypothetical protein [Planctomycetaceae bacterium]